jgi:hypothetical protein
MTAIEAVLEQMRDGIPPALAIHKTAERFGQTTQQLCARLRAYRRDRKRERQKPAVQVCLECGTQPAEHNGRCRSCDMCVASTEQ